MSISALSVFSQSYTFPKPPGFDLKPLSEAITYPDRIEAEKIMECFLPEERQIFIHLVSQLINENNSSEEILQLIETLKEVECKSRHIVIEQTLLLVSKNTPMREKLTVLTDQINRLNNRVLSSSEEGRNGIFSTIKQLDYNFNISYRQLPYLQSHRMIKNQLGERWEFPSDHLPIGLTLDDSTHIGSWSILDTRRISKMVTYNSKGIKGSLITRTNVAFHNSCMTKREKLVIELIFKGLQHPTHPRTIFCLQECSDFFFNELKNAIHIRFPHILVLKARDSRTSLNLVTLIDSNKFERTNQNTSQEFAEESFGVLQDIDLKPITGKGKPIRIINVLLNANRNRNLNLPFTNYLRRTSRFEKNTVIMGDMFFQANTILGYLQIKPDETSPFQVISPYNTTIGMSGQTKGSDLFLVYMTPNTKFQVNSANQILPELEHTKQLLNPTMNEI